MRTAQVLSLEELKEKIAAERAAGKKIVLANGCFDILHVGHIRYLRGAKELGDILVVAINDDESTRRLKGHGRPVMPLGERMEILSQLRCIDYIVPFEENDVARILLAIKPDIHAKGTDYTRETVPERDVVLSYGGQIAITGDPKDHSSTDIIKAIRKGYESR